MCNNKYYTKLTGTNLKWKQISVTDWMLQKEAVSWVSWKAHVSFFKDKIKIKDLRQFAFKWISCSVTTTAMQQLSNSLCENVMNSSARDANSLKKNLLGQAVKKKQIPIYKMLKPWLIILFKLSQQIKNYFRDHKRRVEFKTLDLRY